MAGMWSLGGLSIPELVRRTARESWDDDVFGQAARLAFYHFLAIFPILLLLLIPLTRLAQPGTEMRNLLTSSFPLFLPAQAAQLVNSAMQDLANNARGTGLFLTAAVLSALWAATNASYAMIVGLNTAYETKEDRHWTAIAKAAIGLGVASLALVFAALLATNVVRHLLGAAATFGVLARVAQWGAIIVILLISFALFYRFGPNVRRKEWQWSTPGAVFGVALWIGMTLVIREYFDQFASYQRIYGRVASTAVLMIWLYATSGTVLIGAELNSEIEKAAQEQDAAAPSATGQLRK